MKINSFNELANICKIIAVGYNTMCEIKEYPQYDFAQICYMTDKFGGTYTILHYDYGTGKLTKNFAGLISGCIVQSVCTLIAAGYIVFVLRDDLGIPFPMVVLTSVVGSWMGVAIGFFFGTVGKFSEGTREGLSIAFSMVLCFLSGLMVGDIKTVMMEKVPWFNNINPAALVCDALYALNVDGNYDRYLVKMLTMAAVTLIFTLLGFIMTRRKKYASI